MSVARRIFVSMPTDRWLTPTQNRLKWGVVERVEQLGYTREVFVDPTGRQSLAADQPWSVEAFEEIAGHCRGAVLLGFPRWTISATDRVWYLPSEFCQYEGAVVRALGLPLLVLAQESLCKRVVFDPGISYMGIFPDDADASWLDATEFTVPFEHWRQRLERRRDIFLGYCGASSETAHLLRSFLEEELGATVLDWQRDFTPGRTILEEIEDASGRCTCGIFLFTKDDYPRDVSPGVEAAPRDNVVFEAGYFSSVKGKERVLILRESGARMPADLGGDIYASLEDRADLASVEGAVRRFLTRL
jgi:hypothetical protein